MTEPPPLSDLVKAQLGSVCAATIATELFNRGLRNCFLYGLKPLNPAHCRFVAEAFTLRYIPSREDVDDYRIYHKPGHPQRVAIEECPPGHALIMDCRNDPVGASAGDILVTRLMKRGAAGVVTDGGFRDSPDIAKLDFPAYHQRPSAPTNITRHHAVDIDVPIACGDVAVYPGDVVVGDKEGVLVIPVGIAEEVAAEAAEMTVFEDFVIEQVENGRSIFGLYPATDPATTVAFAEWRKERSR